jgi:GAF domain-containing protein
LDEDGRAELMAAVAASLHQQAQVEEMLRAVVLSAQDTVPGAEEAGVAVLHSDGRSATVAATDSLVYQVDQLQYELDEGPCVEALQGRWVPAVARLSTDRRWPRYAPRAALLGVESQLAVQLFDEGGTVAALNLYSRRPDAFGAESTHLAGLFATQAARALGRTTSTQRLTEALTTRRVIGHAVGILMERHQLDEDEAFAYLVRTSHASGIKLREAASRMVGDVSGRTPEPPAVSG